LQKAHVIRAYYCSAVLESTYSPPAADRLARYNGHTLRRSAKEFRCPAGDA
jgi:hypothetical protein